MENGTQMNGYEGMVEITRGDWPLKGLHDLSAVDIYLKNNDALEGYGDVPYRPHRSHPINR